MTRVLVTGAAGSIGAPLVERLSKTAEVLATDIDTLDVLDAEAVDRVFRDFNPGVVYHLAADKHAPHGEEDPAYTSRLNIAGTENVLRGTGKAKVVLASTCKAADPETAYGASKLIAERMVLNAGGVVIRFYNVRETQGNVFRLWESIPETDPLPYTDCRRYFISLDAALGLAELALHLPTGRYTVDPGEDVHMGIEAARLYPGREYVEIPRRRGDRKREPLCAMSERVEVGELGLLKILSPYDLAEYAVAS